MRRIYAIWFVRRALPLALGSGVLMYIALAETARNFFVARIISNFVTVYNSDLWAIPRFIASALNSAEPITLFLISISGLLSFAFAVKLLRSIRALVSGPAISYNHNQI